MNYGDYAYIEAFPRGGFQFSPEPNVARRAQLFEVWIRPVMPENGPMALRIALFELRKLVANGLSPADFEATRNYLMKNVFLLTATQDQQLGYALDSKWYGVPDYPTYMRDRSRADARRRQRGDPRHLSGKNLHVVMVTKDAKQLAEWLASDTAPAIAYEAAKPKEVVEEDRRSRR